MENDIVVGRIGFMVMAEPVRRAGVNLHIARPKRSVDTHLGIEKVRPGLQVVHTRVHHLHRMTVGGGKLLGTARP